MMKPFVLLLMLTALSGEDSFAQLPAKTPESSTRKPRVTGVELVARLSEQPTQIARTPNGRIFTVLYDSLSGKSRLVEVRKDSSVSAYPDDAWNSGRNPDGTGFSEVVGLKSAENGWLVIIDAGSTTYSPRVIIWDTNTNAAVKVKDIEGIKRQPGAQRFVQDLAVDIPHKCIYTVSASLDKHTATLFVFDIGADAIRAYTIINSDKPTRLPVPAPVTTVKDTASMKSGVNIPVAIDPSCKWFYFSGIGGKEIYRIETETIANPNLTADELLRKVVHYGIKPVTTHMVANDAGYVYCAEGITNNIGVFSPDRQYRSFVQDSILNYPYDLALGNDGYLYISVNQIQRLREEGKTTVDAARPFLIARVKVEQ